MTYVYRGGRKNSSLLVNLSGQRLCRLWLDDTICPVADNLHWKSISAPSHAEVCPVDAGRGLDAKTSDAQALLCVANIGKCYGACSCSCGHPMRVELGSAEALHMAQYVLNDLLKRLAHWPMCDALFQLG